MPTVCSGEEDIPLALGALQDSHGHKMKMEKVRRIFAVVAVD